MTETPLPETERGGATRWIPPLLGPFTGLGFVAILASCILDQASKLWVLRVRHLVPQEVDPLTPFVSLLLTTNKGISYGWFQQDGPFGQWALLALKAIAV